MTLHAAALWTITPKAIEVYREAFDLWPDVVTRFDLNRPQRGAHFLAQLLHESGGLTRRTEDLNYRTAAQIRRTWRERFPTDESAQPYVMNPRALANKVYGGRMGNTQPDDGWKYRGRGPIQITGFDMYVAVGNEIGVDFRANPDLVTDPPFALMCAGAVWHLKGCNRFADEDDVRGVTKAINGGLTGLSDRIAWLEKTRLVIGVLS